MKERPILFSAPMVRAILDGSKTQTRRAVKRIINTDLGDCIKDVDGLPSRLDFAPQNWECCPYGQPGDRLWVRETHLPKASGTIYRADYSEFEAAGLGGMYGGWKPSIFCKREHSRILLEIVSVRVERLQEISEADAIAEGIAVDEIGHAIREDDDIAWGSAKGAYAELWERINGSGSWDANPWVWVIEFKRVQS